VTPATAAKPTSRRPGRRQAADSYLRGDKLIAGQASRRPGHPPRLWLPVGERRLRPRLEAAGLVFLGPPASAIDAMGSKSAAKALMETPACRWCPATTAKPRTTDLPRGRAHRLPVLLKASAGGGGKGMKVVEAKANWPTPWPRPSVRRSRFRRSRMGENTCSSRATWKSRCSPTSTATACTSTSATARSSAATRKWSRSPRPGLSAELRRGGRSRGARQAIGYVGAGTVEFLSTRRGDSSSWR
jgi:3-methylcrotonyl-CoA carboxylase alpha subunit